MDRKIVLKSVLFIAVVGFVLVFSSCQKDEKKIIGKWKYEKIEIKELSCSDVFTEAFIRTMWAMMSPADIADELGGTIEFTKKGKVIADGEESATYKVTDSKLTITPDVGESMTCDYSFPDKKTMCLFIDLVELNGGALTMSLGGEAEATVTKFVIGMTFTKQ